jgi:plastocyanin
VSVLAVPLLAVATAVITLGTTSSPGARGASVATGTQGPGAETILIENFAYEPPLLRVNVGASITVRNVDGAAHTATARNGSFDTGSLDGGAAVTIRISRPGRSTYFCEIHNYMRGVVVAR